MISPTNGTPKGWFQQAHKPTVKNPTPWSHSLPSSLYIVGMANPQSQSD